MNAERPFFVDKKTRGFNNSPPLCRESIFKLSIENNL